jgi:predicted  nucleic acid-binding Zn-ribbon protein
MRERAAEEKWSLYIYSFVRGNTAKFTRQMQQRERVMSDMIGKHHTKEWNINLKQAEIKSLEERIQTIDSAERTVMEEIREIEENWHQMILRREMGKMSAKWKYQREQANWARAAAETSFTRKDSYRHQSNTWGV